MQPTDQGEFKAVLKGVHDVYGKELSTTVLSIWWEAMRPFDLAAVRSAFSRHVVNPDNGQYLPKPADVVKLIGGTTQDAALAAWARVTRAVGNPGIYQTVVFDDPLIHVVLYEMGGWVNLGTVTNDEWPFKGNEFASRYRAHAMKDRLPAYPAKLIGQHEIDNRASGHALPTPKLIGDATRAQAVLLGGVESLRLAVTDAPAPADVPRLRSV